MSNTVSTGSFTIPMMKSLGYEPEFAGAVEAAASTGGQIMPPVMGSAAFLISETCNVPYRELMLIAIIPALPLIAIIYLMLSGFTITRCRRVLHYPHRKPQGGSC